jgi:hypothetical protein
MYHPTRHITADRQIELWGAFLQAYTTTSTRPAVDVFLRALIGEPRLKEATPG